MESVNFNEGLARVIEAISVSENRPRLVSVYGVPDSGKSYLIDAVGIYFEQEGLKVRQRDNREKINLYECWAPFLNVENGRFIEECVKGYDLLMFHCSWERVLPWSDYQNPEDFLKGDLTFDMKVGIYNPRRSSFLKGDYDLVISNPSSQEKPWWTAYEN